MNVDEIVKALKTDKWGLECAKCDDASCDGCETKLRHDAAGLIESLQSQLIEKDDIICSIRNYEKELLAENEQLTAQLAASQRREKAAVGDMGYIATKISQCTDFLSGGEDRVQDLKLGRCDVCKGICHENEPCKFEWRGPQEGLR